MAFKNEYVPPLELESSEFLKKARETLRTGYSKHDKWTVDREREMVLFRRGGGHSLESHNEDYWSFIDSRGEYCCDTNLLSKRQISQHEVAITRSISFRAGTSTAPDAKALSCIKEALREYKDWGLISDYISCEFTLIDAITGEEI